MINESIAGCSISQLLEMAQIENEKSRKLYNESRGKFGINYELSDKSEQAFNRAIIYALMAKGLEMLGTENPHHKNTIEQLEILK